MIWNQRIWNVQREKEGWRDAEREAAHLLGERGADPAAELMLDAARDLKRIAGHLAAVAHPTLERQGALRPSRLRTVPNG